MIYNFDTSDEAAATGALLVYAVWRSRDKARYKIGFDVWSQVERFVKDASKRAKTLADFLERLKPKLYCGAIQPRWMAIGSVREAPMLPVYDKDTGALKEIRQRAVPTGAREFLTEILDCSDPRAVLRKLYATTTHIVMLVQDRMEREKPLEGDILDTLTPETVDA